MARPLTVNTLLLHWIICLALLITLPAQADSRQTIYWYLPDAPPAHIIDGPIRGRGFGDLTLQYFIQRMQQFNHKIVPSSLARFFQDTQTRTGVCNPTLLATGTRNGSLVFSNPVLWSVPNRLVIKERDIEQFLPYFENNSLAIEALLDNPKLKAAVVSGRAYTDDALNRFLQHAPEDSHLMQVREPRMVFSLLVNDRVDYTFAYPLELDFQVAEYTDKGNLTMLPLHSPETLVPVHFACSVDESGKAVIAQVNTIIADSGNPPNYVKYYLSWLDQTTRNTVYKHLMKQ
jgi:uncharacterized protein (TIGR02285 family)